MEGQTHPAEGKKKKDMKESDGLSENLPRKPEVVPVKMSLA